MLIGKYIRQLCEEADSVTMAADMLLCSVLYGASPNNYRYFNFRTLSHKKRNTYVTNRLSRKMIRRFNDQESAEIFEDKREFAQTFSAFFGRKWISTENLNFKDFLAFTEGMDRFIYKPAGNAQGRGILVFEDLSEPAEIYKKIQSLDQEAILEEWIRQHEVLEKIYPCAVNCLRIITVYIDGDVYFLAGGMTWGNGEKIANASTSGFVSPVDFETGILEMPGADFNANIYYRHPLTGENIVGLQVPYWNETKNMIKKAAGLVPGVRYVGWDIAITPDGPVLIEGNTTPGYKYYQIPAHLKDGNGKKAVYEECLKTDADARREKVGRKKDEA